MLVSSPVSCRESEQMIYDFVVLFKLHFQDFFISFSPGEQVRV
jgi:hypothetical protein